ncbi:MAG TPA: hypothetical protein VLB84_17040 [Bacteroidia bacterium]|nr:hypothetical protein [Bacteroidia bacterium]
MNVLEIIKMNIKSYRYVTCYMKPDSNILFCNYNENIYVDLQIAKELVSNRLEFTQNKKHYLILRFSQIQNANREAIEYMNAPEGGLKNILGTAFIVPSKQLLEQTKLLIKYQKNFPVRFFNLEEDAVTWIQQLIDFHQITQQ